MKFGSIIQHYIPNVYWNIRDYVIRPGGGIMKRLCLLYIRRCDAFNCASLGTHLGGGALFKSRPNLPHGIKGIVIAHNVEIGYNCRIFQNVCIGCDDKCLENAPIIGDNVTIYPGAIIVGKIKVGDNCIIAANAVVNKDVPNNTTVVCASTRYILHDNVNLERVVSKSND